MDNLTYLNQISQTNRPVKTTKKSGVTNGLIAKIAIVGVVLFFIIMAFGAMIGNLNHKPSELTKQLYVRTTNLGKTVTDYNSALKSSRLRAIGVSLSTILTNSANQLSAYLSTDDSKNALVPSESTLETENSVIEELNTSLNNAKLNGILDRVYDNQIGLQVSLLLSQISGLEARTKDPILLEILSSYRSSLETIHQNIEAYSNLSS